jgi:ribosomal protein L40E
MSNASVIERLWRFLFVKRCMRCGARTLRMRSLIRATCVDAEGRRYPDSWTYYECVSCGARSKQYADGRIEAPSEEEWRLNCSP